MRRRTPQAVSSVDWSTQQQQRAHELGVAVARREVQGRLAALLRVLEAELAVLPASGQHGRVDLRLVLEALQHLGVERLEGVPLGGDGVGSSPSRSISATAMALRVALQPTASCTMLSAKRLLGPPMAA